MSAFDFGFFFFFFLRPAGLPNISSTARAQYLAAATTKNCFALEGTAPPALCGF